ncbi:MAG: acetamidase/formamidase family protein [Clostridia bacterium]
MSKLHMFPENKIHRKWNRDLEPVLEIDPGDRIYYETRDAADNQITRESTSESLAALDWAGFYPLAGPTYVKGASPGDTLVIDILEVQHRGWGWTAILPDLGVLPDEFPDPYLRLWDVCDGDFAYLDDYARVPLAPFAGTMGIAADVEGDLEPMPPRHVGGNMDSRHLRAGSTLYLPVEVEGGLFSIGDGHLAQGDGEVCVSAIEGPLGILCRFDVIQGENLKGPEMETSAGSLTPFGDGEGFFATMGVADDLMVATREAVSNMVDRLVTMYTMTPEDAYVLCSVAADLKITEVVDPNWIVSLYMPKSVMLARPARNARLSLRNRA